MSVLAFLMIMMMQFSTPGSDSNDRAPIEVHKLSYETASIDEIRQQLGNGNFVPVPRTDLEWIQLGNGTRNQPEFAKDRPCINSAFYEATLEGLHTVSGQVEFSFYEDNLLRNPETPDANPNIRSQVNTLKNTATVDESRGMPLLLGATNLQQLRLSDDQGPVTLGSDSSRRIFVLRSGVPAQLRGTWVSDGHVAGKTVMFRLLLPAATTAKFLLHTPAGIQVTSVGSLVLGPSIAGDKATWTMIPGDSTRLSFSCRPQTDLKSQESLILSGFSASHMAGGDTLNSRWTIGLPASVAQPITIVSRIPDGLRISEVSLEDRRPVSWEVFAENHQAFLKMSLPRITAGAVISVSGESLLPQSETWNLPMLSPSHWISADTQHKGLILPPLSQISVILPATNKLDEWTLVGIQERDVITRPDQSREFQLTQFLPEASAVVRMTTNQPLISESIATIVEPAGRLATVRCLSNVSCGAAPIVELQWPVTPGWQVIAARYASDLRSLFFETSRSPDNSEPQLLVVHLPEALEPGTSRLLEIQLQQTDNSTPVSLELPLDAIPGSERIASFVMIPPSFALDTDLQRRWTMGRHSLSNDEVLQRWPWFPPQRLLSDMQIFETGSGVAVTPRIYSPNTNSKSGKPDFEHTIRIADGLIVENSRFQIPANSQLDDVLSVTVPFGEGADLRWSVDGEPAVARRIEDPDLASEWKRWAIPLRNPGKSSFLIVRCESRRALTSEFVATIPCPDWTTPVEGTLRLFASDEGVLSVDGLSQAGQESEPQTTTWKLPSGLTEVRIKADADLGLQSGEAIDLHVLHLVSEESGALHRELLAVANVAHIAGQKSLPIALAKHLRPLVVVDGHRVQLQETPTGYAIPLPQTSMESQVIVRWTEPASHSRRVTGERELPRLFFDELTVPQCTHHFLIDPELELTSPSNPFAATEPAVISGLLDRLLINHKNGSASLSSRDSSSVPPEIRQFLIQWELAVVEGWQSQTLIDTVESRTAVIIEVTQLRRRLAITIGTFLLMFFACLAFRGVAARFRVPLALTSLVFLAISVLVPTPVINATLKGAFWGVCSGLTIVMLSRWRWIRTPLTGVWIQSGCLIMLLGNSACAIAWQSPAPRNLPLQSSQNSADTIGQTKLEGPEVLLPEVSFSDADIVYVRRDLFEKLLENTRRKPDALPAAVVTNLHAKIFAESADSLEVQLNLGVSAISGQLESMLRIPLQGSHLVECKIDGMQILPEPAGTDSIQLRIPASSLLHPRTVEDSAFLEGGTNAGISTAVDAGSLAAFTVHTVQCRLRPTTTRQISGAQFRLPGLPCPEATIEIVCPADLYSAARAQSVEGAVEWAPQSGIATLNGLGMADGVDVRLLQNEIERGSPLSAAVQILNICETNAGQQIMNCICRFTRWNKLVPEVHYRIPSGFRLNTVSAVTGADVITDLLWSVTDQNAIIQLPSGATDSFVLTLQLVRIINGDVLKQHIPVSELRQFPDCVVAPDLLLAVRTNAVFSVLPPVGDQVSTAAFADLQTDWGQWLRRSDVVFRVPSGNESVEINLIPRISVNEVRISQNADIREGEIEWKSLVDVETSVLPVFRHRLTLNSAVVISDVQVVAGEANRLDSWHRRGDLLVIQLKEGTTGSHSISITGQQSIRPDDTLLSLHSPHLQNAQILESSMTIQDKDGVGLSVKELGGAVPDNPLGLGDLLPLRTNVRMQIVNEKEPVVLARANPAEPTGSLAAIRSADQVTFVLHLSQWSGIHGPLRINFAGSPSFIREPFVLIEQEVLVLTRDADSFAADQDVAREMFDQPEFTVVWTMPATTADERQRSGTYSFPDLLHKIRWDTLLLIPLDASVGSVEHTAALKNAATSIPTWLSNASLSVGMEMELKKAGSLNLPDPPNAEEQRIQIPIPVNPDARKSDQNGEVLAYADTIVWASSGQSTVGETLLLLYAAHLPTKCLVRIPNETVVTEVEAEESTRWDNGNERALIVDMSRPVSKLRLRWLGRKSDSGGNALAVHPPHPKQCATRGFLTVFSENGTPRFAQTGVTSISMLELASAQSADIDVNLLHTESLISDTGMSPERIPTRDSLIQIQNSFRSDFLQRFEQAGRTIHASISCKFSGEAQGFSLVISQRGEFPAVFSLVIGLLVLSIAAFARNRDVVDAPAAMPGTSFSHQTAMGLDESSNRVSHTNTGTSMGHSSSKSASGKQARNE